MWWDDTSPEWIAAVAGTGTPFYVRLVPGGLAQVPGLAERLDAGVRIVDTACGAGEGILRIAATYPRCTVVGVDGDLHSVERARERVAAAGLADRVTENVAAALEPGGWFVVSDVPFPDTDEGLRSVPGRIMTGIQFFGAQIDDQLLPRAVYDDLLSRHGCTDLGSVQLTPMHALTFGRRPA